MLPASLDRLEEERLARADSLAARRAEAAMRAAGLGPGAGSAPAPGTVERFERGNGEIVSVARDPSGGVGTLSASANRFSATPGQASNLPGVANLIAGVRPETQAALDRAKADAVARKDFGALESAGFLSPRPSATEAPAESPAMRSAREIQAQAGRLGASMPYGRPGDAAKRRSILAQAEMLNQQAGQLLTAGAEAGRQKLGLAELEQRRAAEAARTGLGLAELEQRRELEGAKTELGYAGLGVEREKIAASSKPEMKFGSLGDGQGILYDNAGNVVQVGAPGAAGGSDAAKKFREMVGLGVPEPVARASAYGLVREIKNEYGLTTGLVDVGTGTPIGSFVTDPQGGSRFEANPEWLATGQAQMQAGRDGQARQAGAKVPFDQAARFLRENPQYREVFNQTYGTKERPDPAAEVLGGLEKAAPTEAKPVARQQAARAEPRQAPAEPARGEPTTQDTRREFDRLAASPAWRQWRHTVNPEATRAQAIQWLRANVQALTPEQRRRADELLSEMGAR